MKLINTLYKVRWSETSKRIKILFGLIIIKYHLRRLQKQVRFLGINIFQNLGYYAGSSIYLPIKFFKRDTTHLYANALALYIKKNYESKFDDIYFFSCHSGECFLLMHNFHEILEKNGSKKPVFVTAFAYHKDIFRMFFPNIPVLVCPFYYWEGLHFSPNNLFEIKDNRVILPFINNYFYKLEHRIQQGSKIHFYENLKKHYNFDSDKLFEPIISTKVKESVSEKIAALNLKEKFIIISPESKSNETLKSDFWEKLVEQFIANGYDVFANVMDIRALPIKSKTCFIGLDEIRYLTQLSQGVIGLRSGFMDIVASVSPQTIAFYTSFIERGELKAMDADTVLQCFSLKKLPNIRPHSITEINIENEDDEDTLLSKVMSRFIENKYTANDRKSFKN